MNKNLIFMFCLIVVTNIKTAAHDISFPIFKSVNLVIRDLKEKSSQGDLDSLLAIDDFYESIHSPSYQIILESSIAILGKYDLLNGNRVRDDIREEYSYILRHNLFRKEQY